MDILFLNWKDIKNPFVGGAEIIAFEFSRRLASEGHRVTFFTCSFSGASSEEIIDNVHIVRRGNRLTVYWEAYLFYRSLKKKPDRVLDMVNTLCWQTPFYVPQEKRIAYINQLAKQVFFYELPFPFSFMAYFFERFEYLPYKRTKMLCYSEGTRDDLVSFGVAKDNIFLFPLGLDHNRYIPSSEKFLDPTFVFVARLVRMKRADLCIEAMNLVCRKFPKAKLYIVGTGPDEKRLQDIVAKYGLSQKVVFVNKDAFYVDKNTKDVKISLMQKSWALLLPSVKEGWGMVVTEAAACGTSAIVSNVTGLASSVQQDKTGIILSSNPTKEELADAMLRVISDKKLRHTFEKNAISFAAQFSWDKSYKKFQKLVLDSPVV
jgi:glycosyltransferase involved in cell wall biosynthesis